NIVISAIGAQETNFDNSAAALVQLTKQGVSTRIISIMLAASKQHQDSSPSGADPTSASPIPSSAPEGAQQLQSQTAPIPENSNQPEGDNKTDTSSKGGGGGFFDKLNRAQNQVQNRVNGAAQQTQTSVQQGQATAKQAQGTASQVQSA